MAITRGHGNPKWTRDETILALDLYVDLADKLPSTLDERVKELSRLLRALPYHDQAARTETFRNPAGVSFKLQNLRQVATGEGLGNVSSMDRHTWAEFKDDPKRLKDLAALIKTGIQVSSEEEEYDDDLEFAEGRTVTETHRRRERNPRLRIKLVEKHRRKGPLKCEICECLEATGPFGEAIFEAHHIVPLAAGEERKTKISDLALLCANCHRRLHRAISLEKRWIGIPEMKKMFQISQA